MNKISIFVLLILIYLGISKSFSPSEKKTPFLANEKVFNNYFSGAPISVILLDSFSSGFLIKTYHHRYKIVHAFRIPEEIVVRTSKKFWKQNLKNHGMSLFRRQERTLKTSSVPMPPGSLFIGDPAYGTWEITDYGSKEWRFHRTYKSFPDIFGWKDFRPSLDFYQKVRIFQSNERAYYGPNNEFGNLNSKDTEIKILAKVTDMLPQLKELVVSYFTLPEWDSNE